MLAVAAVSRGGGREGAQNGPGLTAGHLYSLRREEGGRQNVLLGAGHVGSFSSAFALEN